MKKRLWLGLTLASGLVSGLALWLIRPGRQQPGLAPTTERDGVGPVTLRRYWLDVENALTPPEEVAQAVLDNFPRMMPKPLAMTWKVRGQPQAGRRGDRYFILMLVRPGLIETELVEPLRFRNRTLRPHPESGWVEFKVIPRQQGAYRLQVQSSVRTTSHADRLAYLLGMAGLQAKNWETVLRRAVVLTGGQEVNAGRDTGEFEHVPGGIKAPKTTGEAKGLSPSEDG